MWLRSGKITKTIKPSNTGSGSRCSDEAYIAIKAKENFFQAKKARNDNDVFDEPTVVQPSRPTDLSGIAVSIFESTDPITELQECAEIIKSSLRRDKELSRKRKKQCASVNENQGSAEEIVLKVKLAMITLYYRRCQY